MRPCLVISDLHIPHGHPDALAFCVAVQRKYKLQEIVFIGDIVDMHALSYHEHDPQLDSAHAELENSKRLIKPWAAAFPVARVCMGNHDSLIDRQAFSHGIPRQALKEINDILGTKGWDWAEEHILPCGNHHVVFRHSWGPNIEQAMMRNGTSVVAGHWHSKSSIQYAQTSFQRMFAMQVGCLVDPTHPAFAYNRRDIRRPLLNVGKIVDGEPALLSLNLDKHGRWTGVVA